MIQINAELNYKYTEVLPMSCVVDKVVRLSGAEFDGFSRNLLREWSFLRDNRLDTVIDSDERYHCLLVVGEGRRDGILVNSEGADYARYSAFLPNVEGLLTVGRYPALAELSRKLTEIVDFIAEQAGTGSAEGRGVIDLQSSELLFGIDLMSNGALRRVVLDMLGDRPEIRDWELDKNELIIYRAPEQEPTATTDGIQESRGKGALVSERGGDRQSVLVHIRAARLAPRIPKDKAAQKRRKSKEGQEL